MIVVVVPDRLMVPGFTVHVPVAGSPFSITLPVAEEHEEGCVAVPITGAEGTDGGAFITTLADDADIQPASAVMLKLYVPGSRFVIVVVVPVPLIDPGFIVQIPVAGSPFSTTLPVVSVHDAGCVIAPIIGAFGATGAAFMTTLNDAVEIHPASLVTLKL